MSMQQGQRVEWSSAKCWRVLRMSGVRGGEGGKGRETAGEQQVHNKKGIHRRQANEADKT